MSLWRTLIGMTFSQSRRIYKPADKLNHLQTTTTGNSWSIIPFVACIINNRLWYHAIHFMYAKLCYWFRVLKQHLSGFFKHLSHNRCPFKSEGKLADLQKDRPEPFYLTRTFFWISLVHVTVVCQVSCERKLSRKLLVCYTFHYAAKSVFNLLVYCPKWGRYDPAGCTACTGFSSVRVVGFTVIEVWASPFSEAELDGVVVVVLLLAANQAQCTT